jgi:peptidoglycan/xylan/chitin deacetylase (PgdA/CDA1 family)
VGMSEMEEKSGSFSPGARTGAAGVAGTPAAASSVAMAADGSLPGLAGEVVAVVVSPSGSSTSSGESGEAQACTRRTSRMSGFIVGIGLFMGGVDALPAETERRAVEPSPVRESAVQEFACFVYHRFGDGRYPSTNISIEAFRGQLQHLRDAGYDVLTLGDALRRLDERSLTGPTAVLTIDDGYASFVEHGLPLLQEFGMPATLFVSTGNLGGGDLLTWDDLKELKEQGIELGNHTESHAYFLDEPAEERAALFRADVERSQQQFRERLGDAPTLFSYPYGEFDPAMRQVVVDLGFTAATAQNSGIVSSRSDRFALPRFPMGGPYATVNGFKSKSAMRALPVVDEAPSSSVIADGEPPWLRLRVLARPVRLGQAQCFVDGQRACSLRVEGRGDTVMLHVRGERLSRSRRTLYTVTAPAAAGRDWHWHSRLWAHPPAP